jgi:hypothetical protein
MSSESNKIKPLGAIAAALDYVPSMTKAASPRPGLVASAEEVAEASAICSWEEMALGSHFPNLLALFTPEVKDLIHPNQEEYFSKILRAITSIVGI